MVDVDRLAKDLLPAVVQATKLVSTLCGDLDEDISYYQALFPDIKPALKASGSNTFAVVQKIVSSSSDNLVIEESVDIYDEVVRDALDGFLEECDHQLDIACGRIKESQIQAKLQPERKRPRFQTAPAHLNVIRPEDTSIYEPDAHPYADLIKNMTYEQYCGEPEGDVQKFKALQETPLLWIDTPEQLEGMIAKLKKHSIVAVDLEHHSMNSYHGVTCLIQISTTEEDYLVDAIKLRSHLPSLSCILSDPSILKVMHGAESDNYWLQRDFNIFLVNLFDTFYAAKALELERFSFAFIAGKYAGLDIDKQHQMSDWRIRPLPEDMQLYARQDTHYLMYIYECMRRELLAKSAKALLGVFNSSGRQCLKLFKAEVSGPNDWKSIVRGSNAPFNQTEMNRVKNIYSWRDRVARQEDTSLFALMPNWLIIKFAQTESFEDVVKVINGSRHDNSLVLKNLESLKEAYDNVQKQQVVKPEEPVKPAGPHHIIFKDEEDEPAKPQKPVMVATELKPKQKRGRSMASAFVTAQPTQPTLDVSIVLNNLDIAKAGRAAAELMKQPEVTETEEPEEEIVEPSQKGARVLKTGEIIDEEELLSKAHERVDFSMPGCKKIAISENIELFDFSKANRSQEGTQSEDVKLESVKKDFRPKFEYFSGVQTKLGPRIPTQPRSGNKTRTFNH